MWTVIVSCYSEMRVIMTSSRLQVPAVKVNDTKIAAVVAALVLAEEPVCRTDIALATDIALDAVSRAVKALIENDLISELPALSIRPGRPIIPLRVTNKLRAMAMEVPEWQRAVKFAKLRLCLEATSDEVMALAIDSLFETMGLE